jgi:hypothetical protein
MLRKERGDGDGDDDDTSLRHCEGFVPLKESGTYLQ